MTIRSPGMRVATVAEAPPAVAVPGAPGKDGATIIVGEGDPAEEAGKAGDLYLDAETGDLFQKET